jgi:fucose permease
VFAAFIDNSRPESTSWANAYLVLALLMAVAFALLFTTKLDESQVRADVSQPTFLPFLEMLRLAVTPMVITLGFLVISCVVVEQGLMNWLPSFNTAVMHFSPKLGIQLAGVNAVWLIAGRLCTGFVLRRVSWYPVLVICVASTAVILIVALLLKSEPSVATVNRWSDAPLTAWLLPVTGFFIGPIFPVIHSAALMSLPVARHSTLASLSVVFSSSAAAIGTALLGVVFQYYGGVAALYTLLIPMAVMLGGFHVMRKVT